jgi:WD40 repeat protein
MIILKANSKRLQRVAFVPNSNLLVASGEAGAVYLWDLSTQSLRQSIKVGTNGVGILAPAPDGGYLLAGPLGEVWRWQLSEEKPTRFSGGKGVAPRSLAFSPSGSRVAFRQHSTTNALRCYSLPDEKRLWGMFMPGDAWWKPVLFSRDGSEIITADGKQVFFFRAANGEPSRPTLSLPTDASHLALSPDGNVLAVSARQRLIIRRLEPPAELAEHFNKPKHFQACAFHPSGAFLATVSGDGKVRCFDARTWSELPGFEWSIGPLGDVAFSADGMLAAACSLRGKIVVWDVD